MIQYLYLGRTGYNDALLLQEELVEMRRERRIGDVLLLLEHPPVLTLGRHANRGNVLASDELLAARGITLHQINRGGDVTYHGPGQLVGYPIFDLSGLERPEGGRMGPVDFVRQMEEALIQLCGVFGVPAGRVGGLTGAWCPAGGSSLDDSRVTTERKIGAIGIHVSRGITSHGFAFNVTTDLSGFALINPCGLTDKPVTSLQLEAPDPGVLPDLESMAHEAARQFGKVFRQPVVALVNLAQLRTAAAQVPRGTNDAGRAGADERKFPAQDTPLQVPSELQRLRGEPSSTEQV